MTKYRKKPVIIEAFQWTEDRTKDPEWFVDARIRGDVWILSEMTENGAVPVKVSIKTLEGVMESSPGDYIIKGVKGEIYACKPDIFEVTYEKMEE